MLSSPLLVSHLEAFALYHVSESDETSATIRCNQSGKLIFNNTQSIHISDINFNGCFGSKVVSAQQFVLS